MIEYTERTVCDICGTEIGRRTSADFGHSHTRWRIPVLRRSIDANGVETGTKYEWFDADLCPACLDAVTVISYDVVTDADGRVTRDLFRWRHDANLVKMRERDGQV